MLLNERVKNIKRYKEIVRYKEELGGMTSRELEPPKFE